MVLILSIVIGGILLSWLVYTWRPQVVLMVLGIFVTLTLAIGTGIYLNGQIPTTTEKWNQQEIVSMSDVSRISGNIFVIGSTDYFTYYAKNPDGSYFLDKKPAKGSVIVEEDRTDGEVYEIWNKRSSAGMGWLYWQMADGANLERVEFHVPKGSIVRQFVLDGK